MSNEPQKTTKNWSTRATQGAATLLVAAGVAGCGKPPSADEIRDVARDAAQQCQGATPPKTGISSETGFLTEYKLRTSVPCARAGNKDEIAVDAKEAAEMFASAKKGDTTIYYGRQGADGQRAIFTYTTRASSANTMPPLADTLSPRNVVAAELPASGPHTKVVEASRAASAVLALK